MGNCLMGGRGASGEPAEGVFGPFLHREIAGFPAAVDGHQAAVAVIDEFERAGENRAADREVACGTGTEGPLPGRASRPGDIDEPLSPGAEASHPPWAPGGWPNSK